MPIAENRRARHEYHIEESYEAGMVLAGWEIKAIRAGQVQLTDGYVLVRDGADTRWLLEHEIADQGDFRGRQVLH